MDWRQYFIRMAEEQMEEAVRQLAMASAPSYEPKRKGSAKYNPNNRKGRCR